MTLELSLLVVGQMRRTQWDDWRGSSADVAEIRYLAIMIEHERKAGIRKVIRRIKGRKKKTW